MKILYLTFYFEPDLCPGSFRNTTLVNELSGQLTADDSIHVMTTQPNRYASYRPAAPAREVRDTEGCPVMVHRVAVPTHRSGLLGQIRAFWVYFWAVQRLSRSSEYDLVIASSSRLFTAFLGAVLARKKEIKLFLDIRDLFREAIVEAIQTPGLPLLLSPLLRAIEHHTFGYAAHINLVSEGFRPYFKPYQQATYSYFTNGIDETFLQLPGSQPMAVKPYKTILYAGNLGDGQGLHKLIPEAARQLGDSYRFVLIGDGGARSKLEAALQKDKSTNVELRPPSRRANLLAEYQKADYLLLHLNDWKSCQRVLPSKLFEYGATDKPIMAGVGGYAAAFIQAHLPGTILFHPTDATALVRQLRATPYRTQVRAEFKQQFRRQTINQQLARCIIRVYQDNESQQSRATAPFIL